MVSDKQGKNVKRSVVNGPVGCCGLLENMSCRVIQTRLRVGSLVHLL